MLANWGNIAYVCTVFPACYFMDIKGLRISLLLCNVLLTLGSGLRCITSDPHWATWMMNIGAVLNGIAGTVPFAGPALLASIWFPPNQRATATAVASAFNYFGVGMAFIIGPQLVSSPIYSSGNGTTSQHSSLTQISHLLGDVTTSPSKNMSELTNFKDLQSDIMHLMYYECAASGILLLASVIYFPSKPPTPPSITASIQRVEYKKALLDIAKNRYLWMLALAYGIPAGVYGVWGAVIDIILGPLHIDQTDVGWIGFYTIIAGCLSSLLIARFSDLFMRHMKVFVVSMYVIAGGAFVWVTLLCLKVIPYTSVQIYAACILGGMFLNGTIPLFYELCSETAYPVSEGVVGGFITLLNNLFGIMFLLALLIPGIGKSWMNYSLLGSVGIGLIFLILFPERYTRTDIDIKVEVTDDNIKTSITEHTNVYENGDMLKA
ncbi:hypothetical protein FSP39_011651 [Pinctada imbricata]|uniref:Disrupted in renal carcinoma protein 2-like protein n=1 Tax=Pinctada imbricata TaxID=66713 RepID=A0AA88YIB4_PINIB|nr:hypothetical protein FSP39_011651 [Pinctada imbricata]